MGKVDIRKRFSRKNSQSSKRSWSRIRRIVDNAYIERQYVGNKVKGRISKRVFQERQISLNF